MADIREKIKKLLALAQSPNENEARDALLKAKELMMKNKLTEKDFDMKDDKPLSHLVSEKVFWTTDSGNIWMCKLAQVIADNNLCIAAWSTRKGSRTHNLVVTGVGEDAEICKTTIEYAVDFILGRAKVLHRKNPRADAKSIVQSYANGFVVGLEIAYEMQKDEHPEWGLVVVENEKVKGYADSLSSKDVKVKKSNMDMLAYMKGQNDGQSFNMKKMIGGTQ